MDLLCGWKTVDPDQLSSLEASCFGSTLYKILKMLCTQWANLSKYGNYERKQTSTLVKNRHQRRKNCCVWTNKNFKSEKMTSVRTNTWYFMPTTANNLWCTNYSSVRTNTKITVLSYFIFWIYGRMVNLINKKNGNLLFAMTERVHDA